MNFSIQRSLVVTVFALSALYMGPAGATKIDKEAIKSFCGTAGGSYSEGSNYARCEYSNGDSYTCNTDVNKCESCTGGKCTVSVKRPGVNVTPPGPKVMAPATSPTSPKPPVASKTTPAKKAQ